MKKIDPNKIYNLTNIREMNMFPWINKMSHTSYRNTIVEDKLGDNILKAKITGFGRGRIYEIKGMNIINYLKTKKSQNENTKHTKRLR